MGWSISNGGVALDDVTLQTNANGQAETKKISTTGTGAINVTLNANTKRIVIKGTTSTATSGYITINFDNDSDINCIVYNAGSNSWGHYTSHRVFHAASNPFFGIFNIAEDGILGFAKASGHTVYDVTVSSNSICSAKPTTLTSSNDQFADWEVIEYADY